MWISGFRYVIASTMTVQVIMKHNNKALDEKLKRKTEKFQKLQAEENIKQLIEKSKEEKVTFTNKDGYPKEGQQLFKSAAEIRREELQVKKAKQS